MYYIKLHLDTYRIKIQEELTKVRWFSTEDLKHIVETKELNKYQVEFFEKCMSFIRYMDIYLNVLFFLMEKKVSIIVE